MEQRIRKERGRKEENKEIGDMRGRKEGKEKREGHKKTLEGDGYVPYLDCGGGVTGKGVYVQTYRNVYIKLHTI